MAGPRDGYLDKAFDEPPPSGRTRVYHGNADALSRDDPRLDVLASQVNELLARVDALEIEVRELRGEWDDAALSEEEEEEAGDPPI